jgi:hypothetical protein
MTLKAPTHVSESNEPEVEQSAQQEPSQARIHVPEALTSHRERDEDYPAVVSLSDYRLQGWHPMDSSERRYGTSGAGLHSAVGATR